MADASPARKDPMDVFRNGPVEVGIAAGSDKMSWSSMGPIVAAGEASRKAFAASFGYPNVPPRCKNILICAYNFAIKKFIPVEEGFQTREVQQVEAGYSAWAKDLIPEGPDQNDIILTMTLIAATKVNYWMMNHHVGTKGAQGYVKKVLDSNATTLGLVGTGAALMQTFVDCVWQFGHWFNTRAFLAAFDLCDHPGGERIKEVIRPSDDMKLRIRSSPAGTAKVADAVAALQTFSGSVYAMAFEVPADALALMDQLRAIRANPVTYHVGARWLTGEEKRDCMQPEQDTIDLLGTFLAVVRPKSSLRNAQIFSKVDENSNNEIAERMKGIKRSMAEGAKKFADTLMADNATHAQAWLAIRQSFGIARSPRDEEEEHAIE